MRNSVLVVLTVLFLTITSNAQESKNDFHSSKQVGLTVSSVAGLGAYYMFPSTPKDNIKLVGIFIYADRNGTKDSYFSIGGEYQRDILEEESRRFYGLFGGHIDNNFSNRTFFDEDKEQSYFSLGAGFGFDIGDTKRGLVLNIHIAYQFTKGLGDVDETRLGLGGGIGAGFNF